MEKAERPRFGDREGEREELWRLCEEGLGEQLVVRKLNDWLTTKRLPPRDSRTIKLHYYAWLSAMRDIDKDEVDQSR